MLSSLLNALLLLVWANQASAAHANFHVQFPWMTRTQYPKTQPELQRFVPFCGDIIHNPQRYGRIYRNFLSFSGHPGDLVSARYTRTRVPRSAEDFPHAIFDDVPIAPSGQLCVNVTLPFDTQEGEYGVMYFQAVAPTGGVQYWCLDVRMSDIITLPEDHPAMCAAGNETLIPMPDEYL
ncbi:hypothetical protein DACRYDRAFT_59118 [Dacryopinax primogenitus]|uniref:Ubiquitin 3 binding protein But2 C-terminal domain-containing protein n=1 Tax=Dacryopinax primogenitus (strain DJM 731) TaxID=1858805 RepID=M5FPS1_DACPD|nr:uncharacterized protein DACRYDRAFT_59118 [Dacryopinax primogenitus]EJT97273.1 hypothetical protein DACRYDRAFT_59118 [Dacryopinax primogenitus]